MIAPCDTHDPMDTLAQRSIRMKAVRADLEMHLDREPSVDEVRRGYAEYVRAENEDAHIDVEEWLRVAVGDVN